MKRFTFGAASGCWRPCFSAPPWQQPAQQPEQQLSEQQRLARLEERWDALERSLSQRSLHDAPSGSSITLESRLAQLESRIARLEQQALNAGSVGGGDRYLESRVRALESEVSRLRR